MGGVTSLAVESGAGSPQSISEGSIGRTDSSVYFRVFRGQMDREGKLSPASRLLHFDPLYRSRRRAVRLHEKGAPVKCALMDSGRKSFSFSYSFFVLAA